MLFFCAGCQNQDTCRVWVARDCVLFKFKDGGSLCMEKGDNVDFFYGKRPQFINVKIPSNTLNGPRL